MELKTLLEAIDNIEKVDEAPMPVVTPQDPKPSMSININAQGVDGMKDILGLLSDLNTHSSNDSELDIDMDGDYQPDLAVMDEPQEEAYANEPDEDVKDIDYMLNKLAGGMNRPKKTNNKVGGGDNPLQKISHADDLEESIKEQLHKTLQEIKER